MTRLGFPLAGARELEWTPSILNCEWGLPLNARAETRLKDLGFAAW